MDPLKTPNLALNRALDPTFQIPKVADAGTPQDVAEPSPVVPETTLNIPVEQNIPSTALQGTTTFDDVRAEAQRKREQEQVASNINDTPLSGVKAFDDPEATIKSILYGDAGPSELEQEVAGLRGGITDTISGIDTKLTRARERAKGEIELTEKEKALAETNNKIAQRQARFRRELRAFETDAERTGVARSFYEDERNKLEADATAELADLYIVQNAQQGNVEAARDYIDTAVNNRYRSIEIELAQRQAELAERIPLLEKEEKQEALELQLALQERADNLEQEKVEAKNKRSLMLEVAGMGGGDNLQRQILNAPTEDQAALLASSYIARQFRAAQTAKAATGGGIKPPTIKEINGVDYQWNEQLGIWEEVSIAGGPAKQEQISGSLDNLKFLRDTTARILGDEEKGYDPLYKGSAQRPVSRFFGNMFVGTNKQKRLEAQVDTLRANMLTLATDPSIKEFFGPQMSDADVRLMTAAGTSLRPGSQSDKELKEETERIDDLLNRMETAISANVETNRNVITAPDGTLIEIID